MTREEFKGETWFKQNIPMNYSEILSDLIKEMKPWFPRNEDFFVHELLEKNIAHAGFRVSGKNGLLSIRDVTINSSEDPATQYQINIMLRQILATIVAEGIKSIQAENLKRSIESDGKGYNAYMPFIDK